MLVVLLLNVNRASRRGILAVIVGPFNQWSLNGEDILNVSHILSEITTLREKVAKRVRSFAPTSNTTHNCYPFNAEIKAVRYSTLTMEGPNLRDEAVRDRIRLAEEFLDRGK
jgi:hypothetical protein